MSILLHISNRQNTDLEHNLEAKDIQYFWLKDYIEALDFLENNKTEIILIDDTKYTSGLEYFIKTVRRTYSKTIHIFALVSDDIVVKKKLFDLGITDYIAKGTSVNDVIQYFETFPKINNLIFNSLNKIKIAILEDSVEQIELVSMILGMYHFTNFDIYKTGEELLNSTTKYDLYLSDIILGDVSGKKVIAEIRRRHSDVVIIAVSGIAERLVIAELLEIGVNDYIQKPFDVLTFMSKIKANLKHLVIND